MTNNASVGQLSFVFMVLALIIQFLFPIALAIYFYRKEKISVKALFVGVLSFAVTQIIIRVPLLQVLQTKTWFQNTIGSNLFITSLFLAFTAGIFEETGRFCGFKWFLKGRTEWKDGIAFGIGHGGIESMYIGFANVNNIIISLAINSGTFDSLIAKQLPPEMAASIKEQLISLTPTTFLAGGLEKRKFGKTGLETSILGFGGFHLLEIPSREAEVLLNRYLDAGGNYIETAASYGDGESELKIGQIIKHRRNECVLATKTTERTKEGCLRDLNRSLRNLNTDHVDLLIMHAVGTMADLEAILGPGGAMEGVVEAQRDGKVGFVGISMHGQADVLIEALRTYPFDAVMSTINYYDRFNFPEIEDVLIPLAQKRDTAIILMKPVADGLLWRSAEQAFRYAMSRPVSVVVAGINTREMLEQDLTYAKNFTPLTLEEEEKIFKDAIELGNYVCRQCDKCLPCPEGIKIPEIFMYEGYYDRQMRDGVVRDAAEFALRDRLRFWFGNQDLAMDKYADLKVKADACTQCGECMPRCPYGIDIIEKLRLADYKLTGKNYY